MKLVIIADLHCGHRFGLTPPEYQYRDRDGYHSKVGRFQKALWDFYTQSIDACGPIDVLVCNGDAIDGKGERSGGTELLEPDRNEQVRIAADCIAYAKPKNALIINGTPYHTGKEEDWEAVLAERVGASYANHEFVNVGGVRFDFKHKVSSSVIPHGRFTAPRRAALWNALWAERGLVEACDFIIRSHVHYYTLSEDAARTVITTPALQGWTKYGSRECEGTNDVGLLSFECENGQAVLTKHFFDMRQFKVEFKTFDKTSENVIESLSGAAPNVAERKGKKNE